MQKVSQCSNLSLFYVGIWRQISLKSIGQDGAVEQDETALSKQKLSRERRGWLLQAEDDCNECTDKLRVQNVVERAKDGS